MTRLPFSINVNLIVLMLFLMLGAGQPALAQTPVLKTYDEVVASDVPSTVLLRVIARDGKSKSYSDLIPLDGGTVGIAHFAVGGLASLYQEMDTEKFFSKSREDMIAKYSAACRPAGKSGNDTGWGCYSQAWWHKGMTSFLASEDTQSIQNRAWTRLMKRTIDSALAHGWTQPRQLAIALGVSNSLGSGGFQKLAASKAWDAEATLAAYAAASDHKARRRDAIDRVYPI